MTSANDKAVLNRIFNPLMPIGECVVEDDIPTDMKEDSSDDGSPLSIMAAKLEMEGVRAAESGDVEGALGLFNEAIRKAPLKASCYNNRAQAFRLRGQIEEAALDLQEALRLSGGRGKAACQAHIQSAMIQRLRGNEDGAKEDFEKAAALGSEFAKAQLVQLNPYAALCNKMLHDVFSKLQKGQRI